MQESYVLGVDFGSDSVRCIVASALNGEIVASQTVNYPRWRSGAYCNPELNQYRQHPLDYIESLETAVKGCLSSINNSFIDNIVGISFDTTASTPVLVNEEGVPLSMLPKFANDPDAMFVLWKDHTAIREAEEINTALHSSSINYAKYCGGSYSCEWVWAKMMHILRNSPELCDYAYSWVEHCDWICGMMVQNTIPTTMCRSRCIAGHKAMWHPEWNGLPDPSFFSNLEPKMALFDGHLYHETQSNGFRVGILSQSWTKRFGLNHTIFVGMGAIDCHIGAIGAGIKPGILVKVIGTSTCDITVAHASNSIIKGICGQVDGSVLPDCIGYEAGQSAFGDLFAWFKQVLSWGRTDTHDLLMLLTKEASELPLQPNAPLFLDWHNGRRTPIANASVRGAISGLTLASSAPQLFASLVESACFGSKAILELLISRNISINQVIAVGGIVQKSPYIMQVMADVLQVPIYTLRDDQICALGAAICASIAAGIYPDVPSAQKAMCQNTNNVYMPNPRNQNYYQSRYDSYKKLGVFIEQE